METRLGPTLPLSADKHELLLFQKDSAHRPKGVY